ncbi:hypothetical protein BDP27DRAFT_1400911 [Rhodocollybia butyracea]|uniref:Uncharacterized protein n=1 Tax=Rhodocollybia butyracea TaxID=206335 RepID=A0A9P5UBV5_9AGAR|nr:hypothetical protein BDP27DRAFT_1400911 [Rhodocollybia butyracea]
MIQSSLLISCWFLFFLSSCLPFLSVLSKGLDIFGQMGTDFNVGFHAIFIIWANTLQMTSFPALNNVVEVQTKADLKSLLQKAYLVDEEEESKLSAMEDELLQDILPHNLPRASSKANKKPNRRNINQAKRCWLEIAASGHPRGAGVGFNKNVLRSEPVEADVLTENLPVAEGAFIGVNADFWGAKVPQTLEKLLRDSMQLIKFEAGYALVVRLQLLSLTQSFAFRKSVPITDGVRRLSAVMIYGPVDPSYLRAIQDMGDVKSHDSGKTTMHSNWTKRPQYQV